MPGSCTFETGQNPSLFGVCVSIQLDCALNQVNDLMTGTALVLDDFSRSYHHHTQETYLILHVQDAYRRSTNASTNRSRPRHHSSTTTTTTRTTICHAHTPKRNGKQELIPIKAMLGPKCQAPSQDPTSAFGRQLYHTPVKNAQAFTDKTTNYAHTHTHTHALQGFEIVSQP